MRVIGLCSYPVESAATRFRMVQFIEPLRTHGIELTIEPFLDSEHFVNFYRPGGMARKAASMVRPIFRRLMHLASARKYDAVFVQREAMFFGPAVFESLYRAIGRVPMVLDLDDATYVRYVSPSHGRLGSALKFFGKTDSLIRSAALVVCGNRFIADYVLKKNAEAVVIPTVADTEIYKPIEKTHSVPVLGWIGTHSTFPFLESIFPVLRDLARKHKFMLRVVGSGRENIAVEGLEVETLDWDLDREPDDFATLDIGLYPITTSSSANEQWLMGKSGFKAIQYLAVGIPFAMTPVGVCAEIGEANVTHFNAVTSEDWYNFLDRLISDDTLRTRMGVAGREFALRNYSVPKHAETLARALKAMAAG